MPPIPKPEPRATTKARRQRQQAKADRAVYAAVTARDGTCCRVCKVHLMFGFASLLRRHHIVYPSKGGKTTTSNVVTVCPFCHADIHAGRIRLSGDADGVLEIWRAA
jgi:5-methylcytosine-specific restriction endonuclease McrA